jgi:hypothetical protein
MEFSASIFLECFTSTSMRQILSLLLSLSAWGMPSFRSGVIECDMRGSINELAVDAFSALDQLQPKDRIAVMEFGSDALPRLRDATEVLERRPSCTVKVSEEPYCPVNPTLGIAYLPNQ